MNIIGISEGYHDSACCLLIDGHLTAAAQEERFSRVKNDKSFPDNALRYCLSSSGLTISDVDCIAFYEDPTIKLGRQIWSTMSPVSTQAKSRGILRHIVRNSPQEEFQYRLGYKGHVEIVDHHLSHAASSYYFSGFDEAAILTVDGVGDWPTMTYSSAEAEKINRFDEVDFPHSLGLFYSALTSFLGFEVNEGEYKVMGLAPYGTPCYVDRIRKLIELDADGQFRLDLKYFDFLGGRKMYSESLEVLLGLKPREAIDSITQHHMDIAKSTQVVLEEVLLDKLRYLHERVPSDNLCLGGGVALNVVANARCMKEGPFRSLFVQPAAGDAGSCLGAAATAFVRMTGKRPPVGRLQSAYFGPSNDPTELAHLLDSSGVKYLDYRGKEAEMIHCASQHLQRGAVIGWVQGRMEFGPRALGARSILADPRRPEMRDKINSLVKKREAFRPFAPAVLESFARDHFELDHPSPFMLETCRVLSSFDLPAITHVDGSARVQTVNDRDGHRFGKLLKEFYRETNCPILLNTSFNVRGEPIVCTAADALMSFVRAGLDMIVIEDFIVFKDAVPTYWEFYAHSVDYSRANGGQPSKSVYSLI